MRTHAQPIDGLPPESIPEETSMVAAVRAALDGRSRGLLTVLPVVGPAFIASVASLDPGNHAMNLQGGSRLARTSSSTCPTGVSAGTAG
jgi:hypothetical protein